MSVGTLELAVFLNCGLRRLLYLLGMGELLCPDQRAKKHSPDLLVFKEIPRACFLSAYPVQRQYQGFDQTLGTLLHRNTGSARRVPAPSTMAPVRTTSPQLLFATSCTGVCPRKVKSRVHLYITQKSRLYSHSLQTHCKRNF